MGILALALMYAISFVIGFCFIKFYKWSNDSIKSTILNAAKFGGICTALGLAIIGLLFLISL